MRQDIYRTVYHRILQKYSYGLISFDKMRRMLRKLNRKMIIMVLCCVFVFCNIAYARNIDTVIIHHTGENDYDASAKEINAWHKERGWNEIGYHYVIRRNGNLEFGRDDEKAGAHAKNRNKNSLGIALSGNIATAEQLITLHELLKKLVADYHITHVEQHHEQCPGNSVNVEDLERVILGGVI